MKKSPLYGKMAMMAFLVLLLSVALFFVRGVIEERSSYRAQSETEVTAAHGGPQQLIGPFIYVPYTETYMRSVSEDSESGDGKGKRKTTSKEQAEIQGGVYIFPAKLDIQSEIQTETRYRGIFPVTVYQTMHALKGNFASVHIPNIKASQSGGVVQVHAPILVLGIASLRGVANPVLTWGAKSLRLTQLSQITQNGPAGIGADALGVVLDANMLAKAGNAPTGAAAGTDFSLNLSLRGSGAFSWLPLADENHIKVASTWPHPKFEGAFLPNHRSVSDKGFSAEWAISSLASKAQNTVQNLTSENTASSESVRVSLINPSDSYAQSERATKYAMLFILLTFAAIFTFEMVKQLRLHPMQYLFVGAAMVVFFILKLSLSEHMPFALAYLISSVACIGLIAAYMHAVLGGWRRGLGVAGLLSTMYGVMYGILASEDNALMMGSILIFTALALLMLMTRKLNWYTVGQSQQASAAAKVDTASAQTPLAQTTA